MALDIRHALTSTSEHLLVQPRDCPWSCPAEPMSSGRRPGQYSHDRDLHLRHLHQPRRQRFLRTARRLGRLLGQAGSRVPRPPARGVRRRAADGLRRHHVRVVRADAARDRRDERDPWMDRMLSCPTTVVSSTLQGPFDWPDATVASGDAVEIVRRMKEESDVPIRSHGSLSLNRALMAAGLVDRIQITVFPVIAAQTGTSRSSRVPATSTSTCWRPAPSTAAPRSWSTGPPSAPGRPADQTARPCRRQGLPGLPWRWHPRPSCMPHGARRPSR